MQIFLNLPLSKWYLFGKRLFLLLFKVVNLICPHVNKFFEALIRLLKLTNVIYKLPGFFSFQKVKKIEFCLNWDGFKLKQIYPNWNSLIVALALGLAKQTVLGHLSD